ncbi:MAG: DUF3127 domain-containing protein [Flavobacteriaceae bacterium]|nr:DUF3127 domain-containing protein [Flavobacteriaceae bacterium]
MRGEIKGRIEFIGETRTFDSGFQVRDFVLEAGDQFPQFIKLQFTQNGCSELDNLAVGMDVKVDYVLNGRKWNSPEGIRYFTTLRAISIDIIDSRGLESRPANAGGGALSESPNNPQSTGAKANPGPITPQDVPNTDGKAENADDRSGKQDDDDMPF